MKGVIKMIKITLKDGSIKEVENGSSVLLKQLVKV